MKTAIIIVLFATAAQAETLPEPGRFTVDLKPHVVLTSWRGVPTGYIFRYSNGTAINETFAEYFVRTGKVPAEACNTCSTNHCGTFSRYPTIATGSCPCGCRAGSCNCAHSKNAGKPLPDQRYEPGRLAGRTR